VHGLERKAKTDLYAIICKAGYDDRFELFGNKCKVPPYFLDIFRDENWIPLYTLPEEEAKKLPPYDYGLWCLVIKKKAAMDAKKAATDGGVSDDQPPAE
jgi:hypothetical protein